MIKIPLTLALCILMNTLFSQEGPLLKKFKFRISNYRAISYTVNAGSQYNKTEPVSGTSKYSSSSGTIGAGYYSNKSTDRILLTASGSLYSSFYSGKTDGQNNVSTNKSFYVTPQFYILNKWFSKAMFTELGANVSLGLSKDKNAGTNYPGPAKNKQANYSIGISTGIGKGRLENVTDMQNALWLYKDLQEANTLSRTLSDDELIDLSQSITKGNNTRVLDFRKRTQFILETVDNYFQQKQLITKTDMRYFSHLNDILFFTLYNPRLAGTEKYIRFMPAISAANDDLTQNNIINKNEQRFKTQSLLFTAGLNHYTPVNLIHQNNYGASLKLALTSKQFTYRYFASGAVISDTTLKSNLKQAGINLFFQHAIYPNTRTIISFNLQSEGGYQDYAHQSNFYGSVNLWGALNYFISYRTRLTGNVGALYQKNMYYVNEYYELLPNTIQFNANVGLEISL